MDHKCKFWARPMAVKMQIFKGFFKHYFCLPKQPLVKLSAGLNYDWGKKGPPSLHPHQNKK